MYNTSGKTRASEYRFPFGDQEFDFVILGSVFTHMLPNDMQRYMSEIARVLKPGGGGMISYFLLNDESERLIAEGRSTLSITHEIAPGCKVASASIPERAVAFDQNDIVKIYAHYGLKATIYHGSWCGRSEYQSYQDIIISEKLQASDPKL
jgi:ubiquinone/menaquinone biosynthesis C-methylase UbiE